MRQIGNWLKNKVWEAGILNVVVDINPARIFDDLSNSF